MNIKTANRLCELRKQHNLSQEELANRLGVSRQAVSKWERSESSPDTDNLILLAKLYGITIDELINGDEEVVNLIEENKEELDYHIVQVYNKEVEIRNDVATLKGVNYSIEKCLKWDKKVDTICSVVTGISVFAILIIYMLLGFLCEGFGIYWFLFILIPVPESIVNAICNGKLSDVVFPCLVASCYCGLGTLLKLWHPGWLIFLLIPVYYIIFDHLDNCIVNPKRVVVDAYYQIKDKKEDDED